VLLLSLLLLLLLALTVLLLLAQHGHTFAQRHAIARTLRQFTSKPSMLQCRMALLLGSLLTLLLGALPGQPGGALHFPSRRRQVALLQLRLRLRLWPWLWLGSRLRQRGCGSDGGSSCR